MNDLVRHEGGRAVDSRAKMPSLHQHLEPERLLREHSASINAAVLPDHLGGIGLLDCRRDADALGRALAACPPRTALEAVRDALAVALETPRNARINAVAVGAYLDSRARPPANLPVYLDSLVFDLVEEGFPPCVVVAAFQRLRKTQVFTPEIAEVLVTCREVARSYEAHARVIAHALKGRERAETMLREIAAPPPREAVP